MNIKRSSKLTKQDIIRQKQIEERAKTEKIKLGHPEGKERFERLLWLLGKRLGQKKQG